jgi:hypothetical protein
MRPMVFHVSSCLKEISNNECTSIHLPNAIFCFEYPFTAGDATNDRFECVSQPSSERAQRGESSATKRGGQTVIYMSCELRKRGRMLLVMIPRPSKTKVSVLCRFHRVFFSLSITQLSGGYFRRATCQARANSFIGHFRSA